jgi:hypothetical protein
MWEYRERYRYTMAWAWASALQYNTLYISQNSLLYMVLQMFYILPDQERRSYHLYSNIRNHHLHKIRLYQWRLSLERHSNRYRYHKLDIHSFYNQM